MDSIPQFLIAAPTSGSGKTTVSRGLMALFVKKGLKVQPFKCGPDYIDTKYHEAVCGRPSINLDTFMASQEHVSSLYARYSADADVAVVEGMMGMYDGYDRDRGSSAEVARLLGIPVVLVVDAKSAAYSMAPLLSGFINFRPDIRIAGVIFNRVGSLRHYRMLQEVCEDLNVTCLGYLPKQKELEQESRHLGLDFSRSKETEGLDMLVGLLEEHVDWELLLSTTGLPLPAAAVEEKPILSEPGKLHISVARNEESFSFLYAEHLDILLFSGAVFYENTKLAKRYKNLSDEFYRCGSYAQVITGKEMRNQLKKNKDILPPVSMQILKKDLLIGEKTDFHNRIDTDRCFVKRILLKAERVFCVNDIYLYKRITEPSGVGKMLQVLTTPGYLVKKIFRYMRKNGIKCTGIAIIRKLRAR